MIAQTVIGWSLRMLLAWISLAGGGVFADFRQPWHSPDWTAVERALHPIGLDGTLGVRYPIIEDPGLAAIGIVPSWVHGVDVDSDQRPRSQWRLAGLQSYLILWGPDHRLWQLPDGRQVRFERALVGPARTSAGAAAVWRIRELGPGRFELSATDGLRWIYRDGRLTSIHHPVLGTYSVETEGAWIRSLAPSAGGVVGDTVLELDLDDGGRPIRLRSGQEAIDAFEWNETGQMQRWTNNETDVRVFEYEVGLLHSVVDADGEVERFSWKEHPGWWRGDSRWPAPVYLSAANERSFQMSIGQKGYRIEMNDGSGEGAVLVFNPQRRRLDFRSEGLQRRFHFRGAGAGMGDLEIVELELNANED